MNFNLEESIEVLARIPLTIEQLLKGISECWLHCNEGEGTWNAYEVVNHLIEVDDTNWIPRLERVLQDGSISPLPPFDRFSHLKRSAHIPIEERLIEFKNIRAQNIMKLKSLVNPERDLEKTGLHPEFGLENYY